MKFLITTSIELPGAHKLKLPYTSKCSNLHGHTYKFVFHLSSNLITKFGMLIDFTDVKKCLLKNFTDEHDHCDWNEVLTKAHNRGLALSPNPTSEVMAHYVYHYIEHELEIFNRDFAGTYPNKVILDSVEVWESPTNGASYGV